MGPTLPPFCLQTRPTPPHLTSAMAENILAAACESETRKAAKRMRLEIYQSSQVLLTAGHCHGVAQGGWTSVIPRTVGPPVQRDPAGLPRGSSDGEGWGGLGTQPCRPRRVSGLHPAGPVCNDQGRGQPCRTQLCVPETVGPKPSSTPPARCPCGSSVSPSPLQDEPIALDKQHSRDSAAITHSTYSLPASSYSQDPVYVNGGLNYSYRGYGALGSNLQPPASLQTGNHSNGE